MRRVAPLVHPTTHFRVESSVPQFYPDLVQQRGRPVRKHQRGGALPHLNSDKCSPHVYRDFLTLTWPPEAPQGLRFKAALCANISVGLPRLTSS